MTLVQLWQQYGTNSYSTFKDCQQFFFQIGDTLLVDAGVGSNSFRKHIFLVMFVIKLKILVG